MCLLSPSSFKIFKSKKILESSWFQSLKQQFDVSTIWDGMHLRVRVDNQLQSFLLGASKKSKRMKINVHFSKSFCFSTSWLTAKQKVPLKVAYYPFAKCNKDFLDLNFSTYKLKPTHEPKIIKIRWLKTWKKDQCKKV